jgi:hypothetical protein
MIKLRKFYYVVAAAFAIGAMVIVLSRTGIRLQMPHLIFTPPSPSGAGSEFLSSLSSLGNEYSNYQLATNPRKQIDTTQLSVEVVNDVKDFTDVALAYSSGFISSIQLDDAARSEITRVIRDGVSSYLSKKCRVTARANLRILIMAYAHRETYFDSNQNPEGIINLKVYLLDTAGRTVLWYSDKAWGPGRTPEDAAKFSYGSINRQLDTLFGSQ